ncbi:NAD dependent epimerase/dehydratase [Thozetella sp. PMI_491]|nr:NAD dependent epimerase/dehydratase [Thozetella sp. PMI_491]
MSTRRVLLTGANGYVAQHVLAAFLKAGHSVRGIVRSQSKVDQLKRTFKDYAGTAQLDFDIVTDITAPGAFDAVLSSDPPFDAVVHTASPFNYRLNSSALEFLEPAVHGTSEILASIARVAPTVKRVVLTSSMAAVVDFAAPKITSPAKVYTEKDWNPTTWEQAIAPGAASSVGYQASKKYAEKAAWDFIDKKKPNFDLVVLNPPMVYGPLYDPSIIGSPSELPESVFGIYNKILGHGLTESTSLPPNVLHLYVDVRDLAQAHLLATTTPGAGGHRFLILAEQGHMSNQRIVNIAREKLPELHGRIPKGDPEKELSPEGTFDARNTSAREILGLAFRSPQETIGDLAAQLAAIDTRVGA